MKLMIVLSLCAALIAAAPAKLKSATPPVYDYNFAALPLPAPVPALQWNPYGSNVPVVASQPGCFNNLGYPSQYNQQYPQPVQTYPSPGSTYNQLPQNFNANNNGNPWQGGPQPSYTLNTNVPSYGNGNPVFVPPPNY